MKGKIIRKLTAMLLSIALIVTLVPMNTFALEGGTFVEERDSSNPTDDEISPTLDGVSEIEETTTEVNVETTSEEAFYEETTAVKIEPELPPLTDEVFIDLSRMFRAPFTLYVDASSPDDLAVRADLARYKTLRGAVSKAQSGDIIMVVGQVPMDRSSAVPANANITITSDGSGELIRQSGFTSSFISVPAGSGLTISDVVFDGGAIWNGTTNAGVSAHGQIIGCSGTLKLMSGAVIRNNEGTIGGALLAVQSTGYLEIDGAELYGGGDTDAGALYFNNGGTGHFIGGSIHDNHASGNSGGAINIWAGSKLTIENGFEIYNNQAFGVTGTNPYGVGGAIYINDSTLVINGGQIYNNWATGTTGGGYGGAIGMNAGTITMTGGIIRDNKADAWGGGLFYGGTATANTLTMTGGTIQDNYAGNNGGGIYCYNVVASGYAIYTNLIGGTITGNTTGSIPSAGNIVRRSEAIFADTILRLSTDTTVNGAIFLHYSPLIRQAKVSLVSGSTATNNTYLLATASPGDVADGRIVVEPGTFTHNGTTYTLTDVEPFINLFSHTTHGIIEGSASSVIPATTGSLVLSQYVIRFNLNKPVGATGSPIPANIKSLTASIFDVIMSLTGFPADPTLAGYKFEGWSLDQAGINIIDNTSIVITSEILYAQWSIDPSSPGGGSGGSSGGSSGSTSTTKPIIYTITYTDGVGGQTIFADQKYSVEEGTTTPLFKGTPSRKGYEFDGWNPEVAPKVTGNAVYKATWKKIEGYYTVTYTDGIKNEFVFADQVYVVKEGTKTPIFKGTISRNGYKFTGWDPEIAQTVTDDVVYTAIWEKIEKETVPPTKPGSESGNGSGDKPTKGIDRKPSIGPNTGDKNNLLFAWVGLAVTTSMAVMVWVSKRRKEEEC